MQSNDSLLEDAVILQNDSITTIPIEIEKDLIKDVALATDIIEKFVDNKNDFNSLHSANLISFSNVEINSDVKNLQSEPIVELPIIPQNDTTAAIPIEIKKTLLKDMALTADIVDEFIDNKDSFNSRSSANISPSSKEEVNDEEKSVQPTDAIVGLPIIQQNDPITTPIEIEKDLIKDVALAVDIIAKFIDSKNYFNSLHSANPIPFSNVKINSDVRNLQSESIIEIPISPQNDTTVAIPIEIKKNLIKDISLTVDIVDEFIDNKDAFNSLPSANINPSSQEEVNEEVKSMQPTDAIVELPIIQENNPITTISIEIEKNLIKDIALATSIIEKIITNKNYFNHLKEDNNIPFKNTIPIQESLGLLSKSVVASEEYKNIEKELVKDIAVAVNIIDQIISNKIDTSSPVLKHPVKIDKVLIAKKVRKIISKAIVSPNLIALERSIKKLLSRKSIFTNFKA